ncbi:hypothetical protein AAFC00_002580 [Neodothiora populina]|uniref:Uncharacterized protein n=1 Tax=Neodothiora populina TaxID=2781224 RepID=A0ABR3P7J3_9PEZI
MPAPGHQYRDNDKTVNPFEEKIPHINEYTAREIATLQSRLDKQLGPEYISTRPGAGGGKVHYLAAEKVINLANEVFGFNGWSSEIKNVQIDFVDESSSGKISLGLSVISRVTLKDGAFHEDVGYGHIENCKGKAAAFEKAKKEAATDAMKRALRNFGNVLGNCLYDKDYLARVTKVKVAPSKWDVENLHRHPDFAPIKREAISETTVSVKSGPPPRLTSAVSAQSNGAEYEDDYGGNLFDEVDFTHPDEVRLDDTPIKPIANGAAQTSNRQPMARVASMPAMRVQSAPHQNGQSSGRMMPPPNQAQVQAQGQAQKVAAQQANDTSRPGGVQNAPAQNSQRPSGPLQHGDGNRSTPSSGSSTTQGKSGNSNGKLTPPDNENQQAPQAMATPRNAPVGFVSGKAATALTDGDPAAITPFDPHHESPSIRRTQGVDQRKSVPIRRSEIGAPPAPEVPLIKPAGAPGGASGARPNFVNPSMDPNRRIGVPAQMASPMSNRNAYKPPSLLKRPVPSDGRPPLSDVSNVQQPVDGGNDSKRMKVESVVPASEDKAAAQ